MNVAHPGARVRTVFLSDIHLGTRGCRAELLLDFPRSVESEAIYLVGDIVDGWRLASSRYWHRSHNDVIQMLLRKARKGTRIVYIPGNHDAALREFADHAFGNIRCLREAVHEAADGRRFLVIHGDEFDAVVRYATPLAHLGDRAYRAALVVNRLFDALRNRLGYPYWSLSAYLKDRVKDAVRYIGRFETLVADEARRRGLDGVVCGHIHKAELRSVDGLQYANSGDWVESCTALVEGFDGSLRVLRWPADRDALTRAAPAATLAAAPRAAFARG
jgi:UDP-2,3-diacylglucosamine pyrophosphatase LpxH